MKAFVYLLLCIHALNAQAATSNYYVINIKGAPVYTLASLTAKVTTTLPPGSAIEVDSVLPTIDTQKIGKGFALSGSFLQVQNGYVFSADVSAIQPTMRTMVSSYKVPYIFGEKLNEEVIPQTKVYDGQTYTINNVVTNYTNGTSIITSFNDCTDSVYITKNLLLSEVYHFITALYSENLEENKIKLPIFKQRANDTYIFEDMDATIHLKITDNGDGTFTISSYSCT